MFAAKEPVDSTKMVLEQLWLKAWKEGSITLSFADKTKRTQTRFALYNVAKTAKKHPENAELYNAVNGCQISIVDETHIEICHRKISAVAMDLAAQMGIDIHALEQAAADKESAALQESVARVMQATTKLEGTSDAEARLAKLRGKE